MSDLLDEYPLYFAIREMHQKFNENSGAFSWLGFCMDSAGFRQELMENQDFKLIGSVANKRRCTTSLFLKETTQAMILICEEGSHNPPDAPKGSNKVTIRAHSFEEMNAIVALNNPRTREIENWLSDQSGSE